MYNNLRERLFYCRKNNLGNEKAKTLITDVITVGNLVCEKFKNKEEEKLVILNDLLIVLQIELDKEEIE